MTFPTFHHRTSSFCPLPIISSLEPSKNLKSKFITSPPARRSRIVAPENWLANHETTKLTEAKTLYKYYQIPVVKPCLHFTSLDQYNIILSLNFISISWNSINSPWVKPYSPCARIVNRTPFSPIIRDHRTQRLTHPVISY